MYAVIFFLAMSVSLIVAWFAWQRRATPGGRSLALLLLALAVWSLAETLEMIAATTPEKILWSKVSYLGAETAPLLVLMFALEYTHRPLRWYGSTLLAILPLATLLLVFTNEWHGLVWNRIEPIPSDLEILNYGHGAWFWINAAYSYAVIVGALFVLASASLHAQHAYRQQAFALLASIVIPFAFNAIYIFGWSPVAGLDLSPLAFILGGLLIAFGIFRLRLLDLVPVARDALFEALSEGVIVLDAHDRIADINPAAREMLGIRAEAIGANIATLPLNGFVAARDDAHPTAFHPKEIQIANRWIDVRAAPFFAPHGVVTGRLIVLRDITERKQMEAQFEEMAILRERQRLARDLHDSVTQSLNSLVLVAYTAANRLKHHKYDRLDALIEQLGEGAQQALKEMRLLLYDWHLAPEQTGLADALALRLDAVEKRAGIDAQFSAENVPLLAATIEHELYLFAMEALNNSLKHASATHVVVTLRGGDQDLRLEIRDDGKGFDPHSVRTGGMGLRNLKTRAEKIGGRLTIDSAPGKGTRVQLIVPLSSAKFPDFLGEAR